LSKPRRLHEHQLVRQRKGTFSTGWSKETAVSIFGDQLDGSAGSAPAASLTFVGLFGGLSLTVPAGSRVSLSGFGLFGERSLDVTLGEGPEITVKAFNFFAEVKVTEPKLS
jgi:hypothetical protein